ncbi:hypothetical protein GOODEAATRI_031969 [Goodea atripinnis]|uniref:Uncharacterized protein n=1 Tax=Goodea atripinnis TaxID=208336 RepID=A0ABV0NHS9_9TELE
MSSTGTWAALMPQPVADAAKVLDVGLALFQSADNRVMSAFHDTIRVKSYQVLPWDASFSFENRKKCHKTSQTKCVVIITHKLLHVDNTVQFPYFSASLSFSYRFSAFPTLHTGNESCNDLQSGLIVESR